MTTSDIQGSDSFHAQRCNVVRVRDMRQEVVEVKQSERQAIMRKRELNKAAQSKRLEEWKR